MKKFLALITGVVCIAGVVSLHRTSAQECSDMSAYMIDASGQCINLEYLQNIGLPNENGEINGNDNGLIQKAADIDPIFTEVSTSSLQQNVNTIVVDDTPDFLAALQQLKAGDRLLVRNGTYQAPTGTEVLVNAQGNADNWVLIAAYPGEKPKIKGTIRFKGSEYVEFQGFEVVGPDTSQDPSGSGITISHRAHHVRIVKNTIRNSPGGGIEAKHSDYIHIESNTIYNVAWGWLPDNPSRSYAHSAISLYQLMDTEQREFEIRNVVRGNLVLNTYNTRPFIGGDSITDGNCFILDDTRYTGDRDTAVAEGYMRPYTGTTLVENNLCLNNGGRGIHAFLSDNLIARNNTIYKNVKTPGLGGELSASSSGNIKFYNNIIYTEFGTKAIVNYDSSDVEIEDNLLFGSDKIDDGIGRLIKRDPQFVNPSTDPGTANFSLRQGSPAIGTGSSENCAETYFDGTPRNGACNLGAFPVAR